MSSPKVLTQGEGFWAVQQLLAKVVCPECYKPAFRGTGDRRQSCTCRRPAVVEAPDSALEAAKWKAQRKVQGIEATTERRRVRR